MAAKRERRANAGNKLDKLLNEEEEDEFYKTSYGGFYETTDDRDYVFVDFKFLKTIIFVTIFKYFLVRRMTMKTT